MAKQAESGKRGSKAALKPDDPAQYKRFLEAAKEAEADETPKGADKAFRDVVKPRSSKK